MTASLPMPQDSHPDSPDGDFGGARGRVTPLPPKPQTPADVAAAQDAAPVRPAKRSTKRPAKKTVRKKPAPDPGPPPPLPPDLVIPPKPPLPPDVDGSGPPAARRSRVEAPPVEAPESPAADLPETPPAVAPEVTQAPAAETPAEPVTSSAATVASTAESSAPADVDIPPVPRTEPPPALLAPPPAPEAKAPAAPPTVVHEVMVAPIVDPWAAALVVKGVTKTFGETRAVDGVDLTVPAGIFYGLVGPNGAGKTTTLSMIAGLLRPDRGSIRVNGVDAVSDPIDAKRQMGVLPDRLRTFDRLTGRQLLHYYGVLRGLPSAVVESRTADLARAFDLSDALGRVVSDYSAGMVKKVMLAGAMIHSPRLLVLDEPFEAVDPVSSAIILDILSTYVAHGGTVILSSHGMELVERVCSRVAVIVAGQVLAEGTIDEVRGELTLEQRFIELAGGLSDVEGLEWLHTFSD